MSGGYFSRQEFPTHLGLSPWIILVFYQWVQVNGYKCTKMGSDLSTDWPFTDTKWIKPPAKDRTFYRIGSWNATAFSSCPKCSQELKLTADHLYWITFSVDQHHVQLHPLKSIWSLTFSQGGEANATGAVLGVTLQEMPHEGRNQAVFQGMYYLEPSSELESF